MNRRLHAHFESLLMQHVIGIAQKQNPGTQAGVLLQTNRDCGLCLLEHRLGRNRLTG